MEDDEQKNKKHNTIREKLKKKRKQQKEIKKEKSQKKKQYDREKQKEVFFGQKLSKKEEKMENKDKYGINQKKLFKRIQKFVKIYTDDITDFLDIFQSLEEGEEIDINEMENEKVKKCLQKLFKVLKLHSSKKVFTKGKKCKIDNLYSYMTGKYQEYKIRKEKSENEKQAESQDSESASDSENQNEVSDNENDDMEIEQQQQKINQNQNNEDKNQIQNSSIGPARPVGGIGPARGPVDDNNEEVDKKKLDNFKNQTENLVDPKKNSKREDWMQLDFDNFMNDAFKGAEHKNIKNVLNKKAKAQNNNKDQFAREKEEHAKLQHKYVEGSAGFENKEDEEEKQKKISEFMQNYNSENRQKSLMEIHQEKLKQKQLEKQGKRQEQGFFGERRHFDKVKDMEISKVDSKRLFQIAQSKDLLNQKFGTGSKRFQ